MRRLNRITVLFLSFFLLFSSANIPVQAASAWSTQTIAHTNSDYFSLVIDSADNPHVSFHNNLKDSTNYAVLNNSKWDIQTVDLNSPYWQASNSLALDKNGNPNICYINPSGAMYAKWTGTNWDKEYISNWGAASVISITLDSHGSPYAFWCGGGETDYANIVNGKWIPSRVAYDSTGGGFIAFDMNDKQHICIAFSGVGSSSGIRYFSSLTPGTYLGDGQSVCDDCYGSFSMALDPSGNPHVCYYAKNGVIKYASLSGSSWSLQTVDSHTKSYSPSSDLHTISLAIDSKGNPHMSYYNGENLMYASYANSKWNTQVVCANVNSSSLALDSQGNPHICYLNGNGDLEYATYTGNIAEFNWTIPGIAIAAALVTLRFVKNKNKQAPTSL
jgi:hypothetical protein